MSFFRSETGVGLLISIVLIMAFCLGIMRYNRITSGEPAQIFVKTGTIEAYYITPLSWGILVLEAETGQNILLPFSSVESLRIP